MLPILQEQLEDPRVTRTRTLLEDAFMELVMKKEFRSITVQDITDLAGINRATFYAHFPDKYALLDHTIRIQFGKELEQRTLNVCTFSMDNLYALILTVCQFTLTASSHCGVPSPQFEAVMEAQIKDQVQELIEKWLEKLEIDVEAEMAAVASSWAIYGLALNWRKDKNRISAEDFAAEALPLIAANLRLEERV